MIIWFLFIIPIIFILIRIGLFLIVKKYGKFSYDGFDVAGFAYDSEKDIFYSTKNAWQKNFGYTHMYDVLAPIFRMIIDTEPVRFYYNGKHWLITFWKGQYGIVTGAEVGVYCTNQKRVNKKTVYLPVNDDEMLNMNLILYKNGKVITKVNARHWWLAVFKLGIFSKPKELSMDISITFPNLEMLDAFLRAFKKLDYKKDDYRVIGNIFWFKYIKPRTHKVWTRGFIVDSIRQYFNRKNVELYNEYLGDLIDDDRVDDSKIDDNKNLIMVNELVPNLLKNTSENQVDSYKIMKEIFNEKEKNIVLLNNVYLENGGCNYGQKNR